MEHLNLAFYTGKDFYSDGSVEDDLIRIIKSKENINTVLSTDSRWPILYHLSPVRKNILNWFPFKKNSSLLEIGAGCGAITGLFCEKVDKVVAVELSKKRSQINSLRNANHNNLEIIVGNLQDIKFKQIFDYITLIGVLEYAMSFIDNTNPFLYMLKIVNNLLEPKGKLFIAIENRFGMKLLGRLKRGSYWQRI